MRILEERILREGKNLGNGILKVDGFINHQVDPILMDTCGQEFARRFQNITATKILTAEISGIAPALTTGIHMKLPVVYARKHKPITMPDQVFLTLTHRTPRVAMLSSSFLRSTFLPGNADLIIDDFLATGATILGLVRLATTAGATIVGVGALIEKTFEGGRAALAHLNIPIESLACISAMENDHITFKS